MAQMKEAVYTMSNAINPDKFCLTVAGKEDFGRLPQVRPEEWAVYVVRSAVRLSRYTRDKLIVTMSTIDENNYQKVVLEKSLSQLDDQVLVHGDNELVFRLRRPPGITFIVEMRLFGVHVVKSPTYDVGRSSEAAKLDPADLLNMSTRMQNVGNETLKKNVCNETMDTSDLHSLDMTRRNQLAGLAPTKNGNVVPGTFSPRYPPPGLQKRQPVAPPNHSDPDTNPQHQTDLPRTIQDIAQSSAARGPTAPSSAARGPTVPSSAARGP